MDETQYIEHLLSLYPLESEETTKATLALAEEAVHAFPASAKLWCIRGDLIQLSSGDEYKLEEALMSYKQAIAIDSCFVEAYEEIGHFYDLVMDDPKQAEPFFNKADLLKKEAAN
jgi:hypothetical protein